MGHNSSGAKRELAFSVTKKDLIIEPYKGSGAGGQHRNKTMSCCRIKHPESDVTVQACDERDFHRNRKTAFKRLCNHPKFKAWITRSLSEEDSGLVMQRKVSEKILKKVDKMMVPENLKIERWDKRQHKWVPYDDNGSN